MKVVKPVSNDQYQQQTDRHSWAVIADIRGNGIPQNMELTKAALKHWQKQKGSGMWGYVDFTGLEQPDVLSILAAERRGEAKTTKNHFGDIAAYKVREA